MQVDTFPMGPLATNCYLLSHNGHAFVIDPAEDGESLYRLLTDRGLVLDGILLTHAHYDHMGGLKALYNLTGADVYLHPADFPIGKVMGGGHLTVPTLPYPAHLSLAGEKIIVHSTPGHSPGSVTLEWGDMLFTGDTLFAQSCGRVDFVGGSWDEMKTSLRALAMLDGDRKVLPGHGESSTLDLERRENPYMREALR
ncbi:MAG: MBL fold metallo-hydrolase [Oscillospiraceae bacterium]|nr:MBL fold metallo-hydrolase [Oscillospiraceae bacterium]